MVFTMSARNQDFEAQQQRSTNPYLILIVMPLDVSSTGKENGRPDDTGDYNEDAENFDANTNQMDQIAYGRFEAVFRHLVHRA